MLITLARHSATFSLKSDGSGYLPVCTYQFAGLSSPLPAAAGTGVSRDNGRVNREQPDITDLGHDVFQIDTRMAGYQGITAGYLIRG